MEPQLTVKGVGFDRTLGGLEMDMRLRDHLAQLFTVSIYNVHHTCIHVHVCIHMYMYKTIRLSSTSLISIGC